MHSEIEEYLVTFDRYLAPMPDGERNDTYQYYEELFLDSGMKIDEIYQEFGSPKNLARQINANYAMGWIEADEETENTSRNPRIRRNQENSQKNPWNAAWLILLGVLASPILIPVALALIVFFVAVIITLVGLVFSLAGLLIGAAIAGGFAIAAGFGIITKGSMMALILIGSGIAILGLVVISIPLVIWVIYGIGWLGFRLIKWIAGMTLKRRPELNRKEE
ncbi:DUF1700 domain-containing protein [Weissella coleopterorum]|uniref:DUF1700 domain-containing protein n=1 Tax=Weissella coleopterorum TaxID=2714949 RepID=A0A6G8AZM3_9LACO|nr:DUF1700 domain-containing protein [Weissella coleopterorum]QIL50437.1 DUF1700 domain-containing protein [Weissella coleopterorum]